MKRITDIIKYILKRVGMCWILKWNLNTWIDRKIGTKTPWSPVSIRVLLIALFLITGLSAQGQVEYNMVNADTLMIIPCNEPSGVIFDDGGANGNYSNNFEGWAILNVPQGVTITLTGNYNTESCCDHIWIYDGRGQNGNTLLNNASSTGTVNVVSSTGWMSIRFHTDGSVVRSGFELTYSISGTGTSCSNPVANLTVSSVTTTSASLSWEATDNNGPFYLSINGILQTLTSNSITLSDLNPNTLYDVDVMGQSDIGLSCCIARTSFRTLCGTMSAPLVEFFDDHGTGPNILPSCWVRQKNYDDNEGRYPQLVGSQFVSAPASLMMFCGANDGAGHWSIVIGPELSDDISSLFVRLKMRCAYSNAKIEVGICDDTSLYSNNFTPIDTLVVGSANSWEEKISSLASYSGTGNRIAFRMIRSLQPGNSLTVFIDDLRIEGCGVWHPQRTQRSTNDFWVAWDEIGNPVVDIEIGPQNFLPGTGTLYQNVSSPCHFSGLDTGTVYTLHFFATCNGVRRSQSSISATTLDQQLTGLNYCEDFENNGDNLPIGWRKLDSYNNTPRAYSSANYNSNYGLFLQPYPNSGIHPIAVLPRIDSVDIAHLSLAFLLRSNNYSSGYIEIGVMDYPEYASSFVPVDTIYASTSWSRNLVSLANYSGSGRYIAFRAYDAYSNYNQLYIDNLEVGTCLVTGSLATNIGSHSVQLRWDTVNAAFLGDSVVVEYGGAGFAEGQATILHFPVRGSAVETIAGKQQVTLSGLVADSSYEFIIYGQCEEMQQHCQSSRLGVHTLESEPALPYCIDFENISTILPTGWNRTSTHDGRPNITSTRPHNGTQSLNVHAYGGISLNHSTAVLPLLDVDSVKGLAVSFFGYGTYSGNSYVEVGVMDDPNDESSFTAVSTATLPNGSWQHFVHSLDGYQGTGRYIALRYYHSCNYCHYEAWIDELVVSDAAVWNPVIASVNSHGATLKWKPTGRSYSGACIEWGPSGFNRGSGHRDTIAADIVTDASGFYHYQLDTLQSATGYDVFITALSSESADICDFNRLSFSTPDEPMLSSFCYGFEDVEPSAYPWNYNWYRPLMYDSRPYAVTEGHSGSYSLCLRSYYGNGAGQNYMSLAAMPFLEEESLDGLTLRFWARGSGSNSRVKVGIMTDPSDTSSFSLLQTLTVDHNDWRLYSISLGQYSANGRHIAFWLYSLPNWNSGYFYLDDISLSRCRISDVHTYSHTTSSFIASWSLVGSADSVSLEYGPLGFSPGEGTTVSNASSPLTISGLQPASDYDFYIRPHCSSSLNSCSESKFTASTLSQPVTAGYCIDFDNYDNYARPDSWILLQNYDNWPFVWSHSDSHFFTSPQRAFEFRCNNSGSNGMNLVALPAAEEDVRNLVLSLNVRCSDVDFPERPMLIVGILSHPDDSSSFVPVDTIRPSFNFRQVCVNFANYSGSGRHIAFCYRDDAQRITYIDDLRISHSAISCLHVSHISDSSISLSWQPIGNPDSTIIVYDSANGSFLSRLATDANQITINGLQPCHTYSFRLWGWSNGYSGADSLDCLASVISATTLPAPLAVPVCLNFEGLPDDSRPSGWSFPIDQPYLGICNGTDFARGSSSLRLAARGGSSPRQSFAVMPFVDCNGLPVVYLDAWALASSEGCTLTVGLMDNPFDTNSFSPLQSFTLEAGAWNHIHCSFVADSSFLAFRSCSSQGQLSFIYLDDINLRSCAVTLFSAFHPTENSISVNWATTSSLQEAFIEYKSTGLSSGQFSPGTGSLVHVTQSPYTFEGLSEATWYSFHIYPVCDSSFDGCNFESVSMETLHPWVSLPYCENFEAINASLPNNWLNLSSPGLPLRNFTSDNHNGLSSFFPYLFASSSDSTLFVLPRVFVDNTCTLFDKIYANFWTFGEWNIASALLEIGVMDDASDAASFIPHDTVLLSASQWQHHTVSVDNYNSASQYIAFRFRSSTGEAVGCAFDDLCIEKCVASNISVSNVTQNSVTVSFDSYSVDTLLCEYGPQGYPAGSGNFVTISSSPFTISGLDEGTQYDFAFASLCDCNLYGATYPPSGGSNGASGGWGSRNWGWFCCVPCLLDSSQHCRYWRWGSWQGHSWWWWNNHFGSNGSSVVFPDVVGVVTQAAMLQVPYCESFQLADSLRFPRSWRRRPNSLFPDLSPLNHSGLGSSLRFYAPPGSSCYAALPPLSPSDAPMMTMSFFAFCTNSSATSPSSHVFIVGVMGNPDDESSFLPLDTICLTQASRWQQFVVDFSNHSSQLDSLASLPGPDRPLYYAFRFAPVGQGYSFYIDDLYVAPCGVSHVAAWPVGDTHSSVSWLTHGEVHQVSLTCGPQGFDPLDHSHPGRRVYTLSGNSFLLPTDPDSSYDVYLRSVCSEGLSAGCFMEPLTINPSMLLPFCETFDGYPDGVLPDGWKVLQRNMSQPDYPRTENPDLDHGLLAFHAASGLNSSVCLLRPLPAGDSLGGKYLSAVISSASSYAALDFGYLADTNDASSFVTLATHQSNVHNQPVSFSLRLSGSANRLAVRARCSGSNSILRLHQLVLSRYPLPGGLRTTPLGVSRRRIEWDNSDSNAFYTVECQHGDSSTSLPSDSCTVTLTSLLPWLDYKLFFVSPSGERLCIPYLFRNDGFASLPSCFTFDQPDIDSLPPDWFRFNSHGDDWPRCSNWQSASCCRSLAFYCSDSHLQYVALPDLAVDNIGLLDLKLLLRSDNAASTRLVVGVMDDRSDFSTFVPVDTLSCSSDNLFEPLHPNLSSYQGNGRYLALLFSSTLGFRTHLYIDNLELSACPLPSLSVAGSGSVLADIGHGVDADYFLEYGDADQLALDTVWLPDGSDFSTSPHNSIVHVSRNPFLLQGLLPDSSYRFYVRCDSLAAGCAQPTVLSTPPLLQLPLCYGFDDYPSSLPHGWRGFNSFNSGFPRLNQNGCLEFCNSCLSGAASFAVLPDLDIDSLRFADLSFSLYSGHDGHVLVLGVMDNPDNIASFSPVDTFQIASGQWQQLHARLYRYRGSGRFLAFCHINNGFCNSMFVDDLIISACPLPAVSLASATSVRLALDPHLSDLDMVDYWVEYGPAGFLQLQPDSLSVADSSLLSGSPQGSVVHVSQSPFFISDLLPNSAYDFYLRCDSALPTCLPPVSVSTSSSSPLPLCEDFDGLTSGFFSQPPGWFAFSSFSSDNKYPSVSNYCNSSCCNSLKFYSHHNHRQWIALPEPDVGPVSRLQLQLQLRMYGSASLFSRLVVGVMDDPSDFTSFSPLDSLSCSSNDFEPKTVSFANYTGSGRFPALVFVSLDGWRECYVDNLRLESCTLPSPRLSGGTSVYFQVDSSSSPDYWIVYGPQGFSPLDGDSASSLDSVVHVTRSPFLLEGLPPNSAFDFYLLCDSAASSCRPPVSLSTSMVLALPACFSFANVPDYSLPLGWRGFSSAGSSAYPYSYDNYLKFYSYSPNDICQALLPDFLSDSLQRLSLSFDMNCPYLSDGIIVGIVDDPDNLASFSPVDTLFCSLADSWQPCSVSFDSYPGHGRFIALRLFSSSYYRQVKVNNVVVDDCSLPLGLKASLHSSNSVRISSPLSDSARLNSPLFVEYGLSGFPQGTGSIVCTDTLPLDLPLLHNASYDFYFLCDSSSSSCRPPQSLSTSAPPLSLPLCLDFNSPSLPSGWHLLANHSNNSLSTSSSQHLSGSRSLRLRNYYGYHSFAVLPDLLVPSLNSVALSLWLKGSAGTSLTVGVLSDPNDASSFLPVSTIVCPNDDFSRHVVTLASLPSDARFIALRANSPSSCCYHDVFVDDLFIDTVGASNFHIDDISSNSVTLAWDQVGSPVITVRYQSIGSDSVSTVCFQHPSPLSIPLSPLSNYRIFFSAMAPNDNYPSNCSNFYSDSISLFTPAGGTSCIDPTNLSALYTTCSYGSYSNPYANLGIIDFGPNDVRSRHTVFFDTAARDPRTSGLLRQVPLGSPASVRLGNWNSNPTSPEAESISYSLFVDTAAFNLLLLKYAAVLQDPLHSPSDQPRFSLQILDSNGLLINPLCSAADFIANRNLAWHQAPDNVLWKDWTTVGVDLSPYAGHTIFIRLTTRDCGEGSHYGYAYFSLECMARNMRSLLCGDVDSNSFFAPAGFVYHWYSSVDTTVTISQEQSIQVPTDTVTYFCRCSFQDNDDCHFLISAYAGTRYPLASFSYNVESKDCKFLVSFTNTSSISPDGINPLPTLEPCESALWDFGDGEASNIYHPTHVYNSPGTYTVSLRSGIAGDACTDSAVAQIVLSFPNANYSLQGPESICRGDSVDLSVSGSMSHSWYASTPSQSTTFIDTISLISVAPNSTTNYLCLIVDSNGCSDTLSHTLTVYTQDFVDFFDTVVENDLPYLFLDSTYLHSALDTFLLSNHAGCDSTVTLHLTLFNNISASADSTICSSQLPLTWNDSIFTAAGTKSTLITTTNGADSLLTMTLNVLPSYNITTLDTICSNSFPFSWQDIILANASPGDTTLSLLLVASNNCDSTLNLDLTVLPTSSFDTSTTVCDILIWQGDTLTASGDFLSPLPALNYLGCDSTTTLHLTVNYSSAGDTTASVCNSLVWQADSLTVSGNYLSSIILSNAAGCDSTTTLHLTVGYSSAGDTSSTVCDSLIWHGDTYTVSGDFLSPLTVANAVGCDSSTTLHLTVGYSSAGDTSATVCDSIVWRGDTYTVSGDFLSHLTVANAAGCDSLTTLHLTVNYSSRNDTSATVCDSIVWRGDTYTSSGSFDYLYPVINSMGCDSLQVLTLTVNQSNSGDTIAVVCDSIVWHGVSYTESDVISAPFQEVNAAGCDSITLLHLTVNLSNAGDTTAVVCDSIVWQSVPYTTSGDYLSQTPVANVSGCDSMTTLHLTVSYSSTGDTTAVSCDEMTWKEDTYTTSGDYNSPFTVPNQAGCDSTTILHLTINYSNSGDTTAVVCDSIVWHGDTYHTNGNYVTQQPDVNIAGCDSTTTLHLTVNQSFDTVDHIASCEPLTWIDGFIYSTTVYGPQVTLQTIDGCDSVVTLDFQIFPPAETFITDSFCAGETYHFAGDDLIAGGTYYITLKTVDMCDSIVTLTLTRLPQPSIHIDDLADCETLTHTLVATSDVDYLHWSIDDGTWNANWGVQNSSRVFVRPNRETTLTLLADYYESTTCPATTQITVYPIVQPLAQFSVLPERLNYQQTSLTATDHSAGATSRWWWIDDNDMGGNSTIEYSPDMSNDSVVITLIANSLYCVDSTTQIIYIFRQSLFAPNAFTPDENQNNLFLMKMDGIRDFELTLFNRQGLMVFQTTDPQQGWNGTYKGHPCPQGAYVWIVKYTTNENPRVPEVTKGSVLLLR